MRAIIIDDELDSIENLSSIIKLYNYNIEVIAVEQIPERGIETINRLKPDLIFVDVEMPNKTGFDLLNEVSFKDFEVIFVTAHSQYAINALRSEALDYLMKPIIPKDLGRAIEKAEQKILQKKKVIKTDSQKQRIGVPHDNRIKYLDIDKIIRIKSDNNYSTIYVAEEKPLLITKTLKSFEEILSQQLFFRIHQSHLVNLRHIREYNRGDGSFVILSNGDKVIVSRSKRAKFKKALDMI